ncbi:hypothetical protein EOE48_16665 [Methylobacterium oryzihabitans]|uniref:Uncharacterized protein n=2 Tax=Methylobacterium oryzihabitans TaxID=2499852 RepID=A0A3S2YPI0_9HYPH|nr:hypothetical protein EOE48_16665 [Methylobacterium oryzihabitans]
MAHLRFRPSPAGLVAMALGGVAVFGWGAFAVTASGQHALETRIAEVEGERDALAARQKQFQQTEAELRERQARIAEAKDDLAGVNAAREKAKVQLAGTQRDLAALTKRLDAAREKAAQTTGSIPAADAAKKPAR